MNNSDINHFYIIGMENNDIVKEAEEEIISLIQPKQENMPVQS